MRNLKKVDFSKEETTHHVSPHGGSFANSNQPDSPSDDGSMMQTPKYIEHRNKKTRSESENLSSTVQSNLEFEIPSNNETSGAQPSPPTVPNLQLKFRKKGNDDLHPEKMVTVTPESANSLVLFISFCINENTKIRISFTVHNALWILGKRAKEEWINLG